VLEASRSEKAGFSSTVRPGPFARSAHFQSRPTVLLIRAALATFSMALYVFSYLARPDQSWDEHFRFARAAAAYKIQHLRNEAGLPTLADIEATRREFGDRS
jgi:hypothetical protein